jgi:phosphohistidine phosphatase
VATAKNVDEEEEGGPRDRFLVLLRHGIAEEKGEKPDAERSLTPEGHARMKQIALGLERVFPKAQAIYSSPLLRAVQTALWVSKAYRSRIKVTNSDALAPDAGHQAFLAFIESIEERRIVLVGHEPSLTTNVLELVGLREGAAIDLKKGGCYGVRLKGDGGRALEWLLSPRVLRKLAETE